MAELRSVKFAPKLISADGRFSGYGAVFDNTDSHGDVIAKGAFADTLSAWRARGRFPPMRLQHGSGGNPFRHDDLPIGKWSVMREDSRGLWVEGKLLALNTDMGRRLLSLLEASALDGLSIGFILRKFTPGTGSVRRVLTQIDLRELSIVDEPSNDQARVLPITDADAAYDRLRGALAAAVTSEKTPAKSRNDAAFDRLRAALQAAA